MERGAASSGRAAPRTAVLAAVLLAGVVMLPARGALGDAYRIDLARSELVVRVFKAGPASILAHDHVVRAGTWQGTLDVNRDPPALAADIRVDVRALAVDEPEVRARHHLDGVLSDDDRAKVREHMLAAGQLDAESYPEIRFLASEIDRSGDGFRLAGELSLHGKTKRIALPIDVTEDGDALRARGSIRIRQSDFGIAPYSAFLGAVRNQDEIELVVDVVATPADPR